MATITGAELGVPCVAASGIRAVTARLMADVDRLAVERYGISVLQMMELAGAHLAEVVRLELAGDLPGKTVVVLAGPGNNGGGGLTAARHLVNRGATVEVILARPALRASEANRHQLATLLTMGTRCCVAGFDLTDVDLANALARADVLVDALLGYSIAGPSRGEVERLIGLGARSGRPVVSLDLPSGMNPDTGEASGVVIDAQATLTLALPKTGLLSAAGAPRVGRLYLGDLGLPGALYAELGIATGPVFAAGSVLQLDRAA